MKLKRKLKSKRHLITSAIFHTLVFFCFIRFSNFFTIQVEPKIIPTFGADFIDVQLFSESKTAVNTQEKTITVNKQILTNKATEVFYNPTEDKLYKQKTIKTHQTSIQQKPNKKHTKYEEELSRHFLKIAQTIPKKFKNERAFIWIKIDELGYIRDFGFTPNHLSKSTIDFLESIVSVANPVPAPPQNNQSTKTMHKYLIPINV